jgi:hypothetical protein
MSGVVAGLIGSVKAAAAAVVNLVTNGSFTTTDLTNWSGTNIYRYTSFFRTTPACLGSDSLGESDPYLSYFQTNALTVGSRYSLSLWIQSRANPEAFTITFNCGTTTSTVTTASLGPANTYYYYKIENVLCAGNGTLEISIPSTTSIEIDDVWVVAGATAV